MPVSLLSALAALGVATTLYGTTLVAQAHGRRRQARGDTPSEAAGAILGAIVGLLGLMLAFTFGGASSRLDVRRTLLVQEASALGTAWLRLDLVDGPAQGMLRATLRDYGAARARLHPDLGDPDRARADVATADSAAGVLWRLAVEATAAPEAAQPRMLLLPALNEAFDTAAARNVAIVTHVPAVVIVALVLLAIACTWLTGVRMGLAGDGDRLFPLAFAIATALVGWLIVDFEFPRYGLVRLDAAQAALEATVRAMR